MKRAPGQAHSLSGALIGLPHLDSNQEPSD